MTSLGRCGIGRRRVVGMLAATSLAIALAGAMPSATVAAPLVSFHIEPGSCSLSGTSDADLRFRLVIRDRHGGLKGSTDIQSGPDGRWSEACVIGAPIVSGDQLRAKVGGATARTFVVPPFSFRVDRATDVVSGTGPTGAALDFILDSCLPGGITCYGAQVERTIATSLVDGAYRLALSGDYDVVGGDRVTLRWSSSAGDSMERRYTVPYLEVQAGRAAVSGRGVPGATYGISLLDAAGRLRDVATATVGPDGAWTTAFRRNGSPVRVRVDDRVRATFATDAVLRVRRVTAGVDFAADQATGDCYPDGRFGVRIEDPDGPDQVVGWGLLGSSGTWSVNGLGQVQSGWLVRLWCSSSRGDVVRLVKQVP